MNCEFLIFCADQDEQEVAKFKPHTGWGEAQPIQASHHTITTKQPTGIMQRQIYRKDESLIFTMIV